MAPRTVTLTIADPDDEDSTLEVELPAKYVVCGDCDGEGTTLAESLRGAFTQSEFREVFDTDESQSEYFRRGGMYDVQCSTCGGRTTVLAPDEESMTDEQKATLAQWEQDEHARWKRESRSEQRAERYAAGDRD
jgi:hypothetical protein